MATASAQPDPAQTALLWRELSRRFRAAHESMDVTLRSAGVSSPSDFEALELLSRSDDAQLRQQQVQELLGLSQSGTSRLISRLEQAGLLRRVSTAEDGRVAQILLTPAGKALVAQHRADFETQARQALESLAGVLGGADDGAQAGPGAGAVDAGDELARAEAPGGILQFGESLLALESDAVTVADAIHVRDALEPLVLIEAAQYRTGEDVAEFEQILARMATHLGDAKSFYRADWSLHRRLAQLCRNTMLRTVYLGLLATIEDHVDDVVATEGLHDYLRRRLVVHTEIIDAIASGRIERVRAAANAHAITSIASRVGVAS